MNVVFWIAAATAVVSTALAITRRHAVYTLLYLIVAMAGVAAVLFTLGAHFVAALQIIVWAGAIMVMFLFVIMMLNLRPQEPRPRPSWAGAVVPLLLALIVAAALILVLVRSGPGTPGARAVDPKQVGAALFGPYAVGVELASVLLLAAVAGAYHLGRREENGGEGSR